MKLSFEQRDRELELETGVSGVGENADLERFLCEVEEFVGLPRERIEYLLNIGALQIFIFAAFLMLAAGCASPSAFVPIRRASTRTEPVQKETPIREHPQRGSRRDGALTRIEVVDNSKVERRHRALFTENEKAMRAHKARWNCSCITADKPTTTRKARAERTAYDERRRAARAAASERVRAVATAKSEKENVPEAPRPNDHYGETIPTGMDAGELEVWLLERQLRMRAVERAVGRVLDKDERVMRAEVKRREEIGGVWDVQKSDDKQKARKPLQQDDAKAGDTTDLVTEKATPLDIRYPPDSLTDEGIQLWILEQKGRLLAQRELTRATLRHQKKIAEMTKKHQRKISGLFPKQPRKPSPEELAKQKADREKKRMEAYQEVLEYQVQLGIDYKRKGDGNTVRDETPTPTVKRGKPY